MLFMDQVERFPVTKFITKKRFIRAFFRQTWRVAQTMGPWIMEKVPWWFLKTAVTLDPNLGVKVPWWFLKIPVLKDGGGCRSLS